MKKQTVLNVLTAVIFAAALFATFTFIFLKEPISSVKGTTESVPYAERYEEENCGLLVRFRDGNSVFLNFDFSDIKVSVLMLPNGADTDTVKAYGYSVYKTVDTDYTFLGRFADRLGGIELTDNDSTHKYTGVQLKEKLATSPDKNLRRQVINVILSRFYSRGLSKEDLVFVIESTETDLNFPDAYNLSAPISSVCKNINFIN